MLKAIADLIKVKTLVTLALTGAFVYLCVIGKIDTQQFITVFSVVIAFYFGTQHERTTKETEEQSKTE